MNMDKALNKIIVVDDNVTNLDAAKDLLSPFYSVYPAKSADMLFKILEKIKPDLILLDIAMPDMDGYETIKKLKKDWHYSEIPVIFLTAKGDEESEFKGFDLGAVDFVAKPFSPKVLLKRIETHLLLERQKAELDIARLMAEDENRNKSTFLAGMSHELRTPLNAILGFNEIIMSEMFGSIGNDRYKEYLRHIHASSSHLLELINDVLDLAKIEANKIVVHEENIDVREMTRDVLNIIKGYHGADKRIIETGVNIEADALPQIFIDGRMLSQIILNLLSNAVKFTREQDRIAFWVTLSAAGEMEFTVRDNGIGIAKDKQEKIFDDFEQDESQNNLPIKKHAGTGLGLSLVKAYTGLFGGRVELVSEIGKGSEFKVIFPKERTVGPGDKS